MSFSSVLKGLYLCQSYKILPSIQLFPTESILNNLVREGHFLLGYSIRSIDIFHSRLSVIGLGIASMPTGCTIKEKIDKIT